MLKIYSFLPLPLISLSFKCCNSLSSPVGRETKLQHWILRAGLPHPVTPTQLIKTKGMETATQTAQVRFSELLGRLSTHTSLLPLAGLWHRSAPASCYTLIYAVVIKHPVRKQFRRETVYLSYNSRSQSITGHVRVGA